jgi:SAM-dependent methyltransferase
MRRRLLLCVVLLSIAVAAAPQSPLPPSATAVEVATYEAFRAWITAQPVAVQNADDGVVYERYAAELRAQKKSERDIAATIASLKSIGDRAEIERWNRILTATTPAFNTAPNDFLVAVTKALKAGRALDVGMGQGRNTIYLAQRGWDSVGFDPADRAVAAAREQAARLGVKITTIRGSCGWRRSSRRGSVLP